MGAALLLAIVAAQAAPALPTRLSWALGIEAGGTWDALGVGNSTGGPIAVTPPLTTEGGGLRGRLGAQFGSHLGVEGEVSGATLFSSAYLRGAATLEVTPADWLTVALGPVTRWAGCRNCQELDAWTDAGMVGGTLRVDFHLGVRRAPTARSAFTLSVSEDFGAAVAGSVVSRGSPSAALALVVGWSRY